MTSRSSVAPSAPSIAETAERTPIVTKIVGLYVFLLFCRILEVLPVFGLGALRLMLVIAAIALVIVFTTGNLVRALKTPLGVLLVAWTAWMVICMPFSTWHSETLSQFVNIWLKSLAVFFIVAGLGGTLSSFRAVTTAMGWAAAAAAVVVLPGIATAGTGNGANDRLVGIGTLSNPNEIAFHLWLGMSFLLLLAARGGKLKRAFLVVICCFELVLIVKTVSREGLLLGLVVFVMAVFRVSAINKMKLLLAAFGVCLFAVMSLSPQAVDRYMTLFTSDVSGAAVRSAEASTKMRHQKLMESIELTLRHPIFGVGMGVFMPASVEIAKEKGNVVDWQVSHNSYTQVSSELGFPGILLLLAIYFVAWRQLRQIDKASKRLGREDISQLAFALRVALVVLCAHFCFDSMAYLFYMPLVAGLIAAFVLAYRPVLNGSGNSGIEAESGVMNMHAWLGAKHESGDQVVATRTGWSARKHDPTAETPNPYRFGRRR